MPRKNDRAIAPLRGPGLASMRPRPDAAEKLPTSVFVTPFFFSRFNEAAARCRGKTRRGGRRRRRTRRRFNEAAARCRGKTPPPPHHCAGKEVASMRPRPDAAEKQNLCRNRARRGTHASMRPRPDAAEKPIEVMGLPAAPTAASMRPRPDAAEKRTMAKRWTADGLASMRPRPDAAEKREQERDLAVRVPLRASMRPRPDAAEKQERWRNRPTNRRRLQ